jgi:uncharacterized protein
MKFSRYNFLYSSKEYGKLLFNTRTKYFASLDAALFNLLKNLSSEEIRDIKALNIPDDILKQFIEAKVLIKSTEDEDFFYLKKYLRYKQTFSNNQLGLIIVPTFSCNFKCPYCYEYNLPSKTISDYTISGIINFLKLKGTKNINLCWHGGEPLLAFDKIVKFLDEFNRCNGFTLSSHAMVTNGFLLDDHKCKILKNYNLDTVQITIDGDRNAHNQSRIHKQGIPTYDTIIANVENIFKYIPNCQVIIRVNLHKENKEIFPKIYHQLKTLWGNQKYSFNIAFVNDINNTCKVGCLADQEKIPYLKSLYKDFGIKDISINANPIIGGCTAAYNNSFIIGPSGEIYKCWVDVGKREKITGNIWNNNISNYILSSYVVGSDMFTDTQCKKCTFFPLCDGGCIVRRYNKKHYNIDYTPCYYDNQNFKSLLDFYYLKLQEKTNIK